MNEQENEETISRRSLIDQSARFPVLFFITSGSVWLLIAVILGFIQQMKMHSLFSGCVLALFSKLRRSNGIHDSSGLWMGHSAWYRGWYLDNGSALWAQVKNR